MDVERAAGARSAVEDPPLLPRLPRHGDRDGVPEKGFRLLKRYDRVVQIPADPRWNRRRLWKPVWLLGLVYAVFGATWVAEVRQGTMALQEAAFVAAGTAVVLVGITLFLFKRERETVIEVQHGQLVFRAGRWRRLLALEPGPVEMGVMPRSWVFVAPDRGQALTVPKDAFPDLPAQIAADPELASVIRITDAVFETTVPWTTRVVSAGMVIFAVVVLALMALGMLRRVGLI